MDYFNDLYPIYPPNPDKNALSDSDASERNEKNEILTRSRKRKKISFDDFCAVHSNDLWYLWCMIEEYNIYTRLLNRMNYADFCVVCYENTV
jgi:hypothetical protein